MQSRRRNHTLPARFRNDYALATEAAAESKYDTWSEGSTGRKRGRADRGLMSIRELQAAFAEHQPTEAETETGVDPDALADVLFGPPLSPLADAALSPVPCGKQKSLRRSPPASPTEEIDTMAMLESLVREELASERSENPFALVDGSDDSPRSNHSSTDCCEEDDDDAFADEVSSLFMLMGAEDDERTPFELLATPDMLLDTSAPQLLPVTPLADMPMTDEMHAAAPSSSEEKPATIAEKAAATAAAASLSEKSAGARNVAERKEWSAAEDALIRSSVESHGCKWRVIAAQLPGRSDDAVRNRWNRLKEAQAAKGETGSELAASDSAAAAPKPRAGGGRPRAHSMSSSSAAEGDAGAPKPERISWSRQEDETIVSSVSEFGHKWGKIAQRLPGRTEHAIRNRYSRLQSLAAENKPAAAMPPPPNAGQVLPPLPAAIAAY